jgi:outer membrane protein TolC
MLELKLRDLPADSLSLNQDSMSGIEIMFSQAVPFPGKRALRGQIAMAEAAMTSEEYQDMLLEIVGNVKHYYYDLWEADRALEAIQLTHKSLQDTIKIAETRYSVGLGLQQDILRAQLELSRLLDDEFMWKRTRAGALAGLNETLGLPPQSPLGAPGKVEKTPMPFNLMEWQEKALASQPRLRQAQAAVNRAQANEAFAVKDLKPDFTFGLGYMFRSTDPLPPGMEPNMVTATVGMNLPIYAKSKQRMRIVETRRDLEAARARQEAARLQIQSKLADLFAEAERNGKQVDLYRKGIIPQAELAFESARSGYQVGKLDFLSLLDAQTKLYDYQLAYYQSLAAYQRTLAEIERTAGGTLSPLH